MKHSILLLLIISLSIFSGCSQQPSPNSTTKRVGGTCEGCEAIYESPIAFDKLENMVWLSDWKDKMAHPDMKATKLAVNGIVYKADGKTPAPGVVIYIYHTDQTGVYPKKGDEKGWAKRHGYLRGWMKTNEKGEYKFFTLRPMPYPGRTAPAHIHVTIKEPDRNEYWIDEYVFDDDPLLTKEHRDEMKNHGGNGVLLVHTVEKDFQKASRNIYLGKNIQDYK